VDRCCRDDAERKSFLRSCLSSEMQMQLGKRLLHPGLYEQCLQELHQKFENPRVIATACSKALLELVSFYDGDFKALQKISESLRSCAVTLCFGGYGVCCHATLAHVVSKLPHTLRSRWAEYSYAIMDCLPDLSDLDSWLDNCAMAEYCVRAGSERASAPTALGN
jgi:hypothetical protein